jgi:hypothetical protein
LRLRSRAVIFSCRSRIRSRINKVRFVNIFLCSEPHHEMRLRSTFFSLEPGAAPECGIAAHFFSIRFRVRRAGAHLHMRSPQHIFSQLRLLELRHFPRLRLPELAHFSQVATFGTCIFFLSCDFYLMHLFFYASLILLLIIFVMFFCTIYCSLKLQHLLYLFTFVAPAHFILL